MNRRLLYLGILWIAAGTAQAASVATQEFKAVLAKKANLEHGAELFQTCVACHGANGSGSEAGDVPRIAGQHYSYLLRQMYDAVDGRRPNFSRSHVRLLAKLQRDDFVGIADFLARAEWAGPVARLTQVR